MSVAARRGSGLMERGFEERGFEERVGEGVAGIEEETLNGGFEGIHVQ